MKRRLINVATAITGFAAVAVLLLWAVTSRHGVTCFWSHSGKLTSIQVERGSILFLELHNYKFNTPFRWNFYHPETKERLASFKKLTAWWHGDNSWWERVGYTVHARRRCCGFEYASGQYWPPFAWQHPKVPFTVLQIPLWAFVAVFLLPISFRLCLTKKWRELRTRQDGGNPLAATCLDACTDVVSDKPSVASRVRRDRGVFSQVAHLRSASIAVT